MAFATPDCPTVFPKEVPVDNASYPAAAGDADTSLLEGLFQLALTGQTQGWEYDQINQEVYARLLSAYGADMQRAA